MLAVPRQYHALANQHVWPCHENATASPHVLLLWVLYYAQACTELTLSNKIQRHFPLLATQTYCGVLQDNAKSVQLAISIQQRLPQLTASSQLQKQLSLASFSLIVYTGPDRLNIPGEPEYEAHKVRSHFMRLST